MDEQLQPQPLPEAPISQMALSHLRASMPWMRFVAIAGIVLCALMVLAGLSIMATVPMGGVLFIFYLIAGVVCFFPQLYLLQYSNNLRDYLDMNNPDLLEKAFEKQKSFWTYVGVLVIIYLALIALIILAVIIGGASIFSLMGHHSYYQQNY